MGRAQQATKEVVMAAVRQLLDEGVNPTPHTVREITRVGTFSRLGPLIAECMGEIRAAEASEKLLKPELVHLGTRLFQDAVGRVSAELESDFAGKVADIERKATAEIAAAKDLTTKAYEVADSLEAQLESIRADLGGARADHQAASERAAGAEACLAAQAIHHVQERDRLIGALERAEAAKELAQAQAAEARGQIGALREQLASKHTTSA